MPIVVKDYSWEESESHVFITVPLKGVRPNKVDIFSTETYMKVSYPPYIFECFLKAAVLDQKSAAQIGNGSVLFKLEKDENKLWGMLQNPDIDRHLQRELREEAIKRVQERAAEELEKKEEAKRLINKYGVNQQMSLENSEHSRISDAKEAERRKATDDLETWKIEQDKLAQLEHQKDIEEKRQQDLKRKAELEARLAGDQKAAAQRKSNIFHDQAEGAPLREVGKIGVTFTPRTFPTPSRESTKADEDAWLKKQAEAARIVESEDQDLTEEERDPVWLRDKGNSFFKAGNYQAAVNVFNHAIRLNKKMPALYSNRAACHLKLRNFIKSVEDSSKALELLTPPVQLNAASRCKAHVRRGTAFCQLELYVEGLQDYEAALKIDLNNEQLNADAERIRGIIQGSDYPR